MWLVLVRGSVKKYTSHPPPFVTHANTTHNTTTFVTLFVWMQVITSSFPVYSSSHANNHSNLKNLPKAFFFFVSFSPLSLFFQVLSKISMHCGNLIIISITITFHPFLKMSSGFISLKSRKYTSHVSTHFRQGTFFFSLFARFLILIQSFSLSFVLCRYVSMYTALPSCFGLKKDGCGIFL